VQIRSDCNGEIGGCYGGYWAHRFSIAEQRANFLPPVRSRSSCIVEQCHGKDRYQKVWSPAQAGALTISAIGSSRHFALPQDFGRKPGIAEVGGHQSIAEGDAYDPKRTSR